ncbi:MAG: TRAP transporter small permease subunit [Thiovulaceae bacterium]|nr:TRAP transporter small permease subunit [Sulfurimonadaceae bacterium]
MVRTAFFIQTLSQWLERLTAMVLMILVVIVVYDASMRFLFSQGSIMLQELEWHLFDIVMLFSLSVTLKYNQHVRVDIFYHNFSQQTQELINLLGYLFMVIPFSLLIIIVGLDYVQMSFIQMEGSANPDGLPYRYVIKSMMILGFAFVILQAIAEILQFLIKRASK